MRRHLLKPFLWIPLYCSVKTTWPFCAADGGLSVMFVILLYSKLPGIPFEVNIPIIPLVPDLFDIYSIKFQNSWCILLLAVLCTVFNFIKIPTALCVCSIFTPWSFLPGIYRNNLNNRRKFKFLNENQLGQIQKI